MSKSEGTFLSYTSKDSSGDPLISAAVGERNGGESVRELWGIKGGRMSRQEKQLQGGGLGGGETQMKR